MPSIKGPRPWLIAYHTKHGMTKDPVFAIWRGMKSRCLNPNDTGYKHYGARGITICPEWQTDFMAFYRDMGPRPSPLHMIERKDNDGPYASWNCRWATREEQQQNTRQSRHFTYAGMTLSIAGWAKRLGLPYDRLYGRLAKRGWSVDRALTTL